MRKRSFNFYDRKPDLRSNVLFTLVILFLGIEYVNLPGSASIFKIAVAPLSVFGIFSILSRGLYLRAVPPVFILLIFPSTMIATGVNCGSSELIINAMGLIPVLSFIYFYSVHYEWKRLQSIALATYSIPHIIALLLFITGISNIAYTDGLQRFDGLHIDPNLMSAFVLAAISAKVVLISNTHNKEKLFWMVAIGVDVIMIIMSGSRGGVLGGISILILFAFGCWGIARFVYYLVPIAVVIAAIFRMFSISTEKLTDLPGVGGLLKRFLDSSIELGTSSGSRIYLWEKALNEIGMSGGIFGITGDYFVGKYGNHPHNTIIDSALECGPLGAFLLVALIAFCLFGLIKFQPQQNNYQANILLFGISFWVCFLFLSGFSSKVYWLSIAIPFGHVIGKSLMILPPPKKNK